MSAELRVEGSVAKPLWKPSRRRAFAGLVAAAGAALAGSLAGCSGTSSYFSSLPSLSSPQQQAPAGPPVPETTLGTGQVRVALILPLSAGGNAGVAGQAMRNAAEMALAEFNAPNIQLLVKDDAGTPDGARVAAQQALDEGAELILGPLFAQSVSIVGQIARSRNIPVIAFSTDANVATRGVYLLSFLPESDVARIVQYAASTGKALLRGAHSRQSVRDRRRSGVPPGRRAPRRPGRRARALSARQSGDGRSGHATSRWRRLAPTRSLFPMAATRFRILPRLWWRAASTPRRSSCSAPDCGTIRACFNASA